MTSLDKLCNTGLLLILVIWTYIAILLWGVVIQYRENVMLIRKVSTDVTEIKEYVADLKESGVDVYINNN